MFEWAEHSRIRLEKAAAPRPAAPDVRKRDQSS
jgi:hypothetical protein